MIRIWLIWAGNISIYFTHAIDQLSHLFRLSVVCDINYSVLERYQSKGILTLRDYKNISKKDIDAVIITTPNSLHKEIILHFAHIWIDILCEKPLSLTYEDTKEVVQNAKEQHIILQSAFHRNYNAHFLNLLRQISQKTIRKVKIRYWEDISLHSLWEDWYNDIRKSWGWCIIDNGINCFALLEKIVWEYALKDIKVKKWHEINGIIETHALIDLTYNTWSANIELRWDYPWEKKDIVIYTTENEIYRCDLLSWYNDFKSSLWHEYVWIMEHFSHTIMKSKSNYSDTKSLHWMQIITEIYNQIRN